MPLQRRDVAFQAAYGVAQSRSPTPEALDRIVRDLPRIRGQAVGVQAAS